MEPDYPSKLVKELIDDGSLEAPVTVSGVYRGKTIEATLERDGSFLWNGETLASPSVAAGKAITAATGFRSPGRQYASVNGWKFWIVEKDGQSRSLAEIRDGSSR